MVRWRVVSRAEAMRCKKFRVGLAFMFSIREMAACPVPTFLANWLWLMFWAILAAIICRAICISGSSLLYSSLNLGFLKSSFFNWETV